LETNGYSPMGCEIGEIEMRRLATNAALLSVLATLAMSGTAAAFTPVPIPKPQASSVVHT